MGKVFELIIKPWLVESVREAGDLSDDQKGFRDGHSTIGAIRRVVDTDDVAVVIQARDSEAAQSILTEVMLRVVRCV